jgi:hypothetical protein
VKLKLPVRVYRQIKIGDPGRIDQMLTGSERIQES